MEVFVAFGLQVFDVLVKHQQHVVLELDAEQIGDVLCAIETEESKVFVVLPIFNCCHFAEFVKEDIGDPLLHAPSGHGLIVIGHARIQIRQIFESFVLLEDCNILETDGVYLYRKQFFTDILVYADLACQPRPQGQLDGFLFTGDVGLQDVQQSGQ